MVQINVKSKFERKVFRREDKVAAAEVREHRTWDRFALNLGINLSHLKASLLDDTAFLVGTPVKSLYLTADSVLEREHWALAFAESFGKLKAAEDATDQQSGSSGGGGAAAAAATAAGGGGGGLPKAKRGSTISRFFASSSK